MYIEQLRSHPHQEQEPHDYESGIEADNGSSGYESFEDNREKLNRGLEKAGLGDDTQKSVAGSGTEASGSSRSDVISGSVIDTRSKSQLSDSKEVHPVIGASGRPADEENLELPESEQIEYKGRRYVTLDQAAELLNITPQQVYNLIYQEKIRQKKLATVVLLSDVLEYSKNRKIGRPRKQD